ncbi:MAG: hypothetical protein RBT74_00270 [Tenuifilaceae bacterium]|nr:hypothetical protein [Tenuifilaceae bacterium]
MSPKTLSQNRKTEDISIEGVTKWIYLSKRSGSPTASTAQAPPSHAPKLKGKEVR